MVQQNRHRVRALHRRQPTVGAAEGFHRDLITLPQRHVRDQQHGVENVVELRDPAVERAHPPPGIEQENDRLVALLLIVPADQHLPAGRSLPVDLPQRVAVAVVAELMEIPARSRARAPHDAHRALAVLHGEQRETDHRLVVRIDLHHFSQQVPGLPRPESHRGKPPHVHGAEHRLAPLRQGHRMKHPDLPVRRHLAAPRQRRSQRALRNAVENLHLGGAAAFVP